MILTGLEKIYLSKQQQNKLTAENKMYKTSQFRHHGYIWINPWIINEFDQIYEIKRNGQVSVNILAKTNRSCFQGAW